MDCCGLNQAPRMARRGTDLALFQGAGQKLSAFMTAHAGAALVSGQSGRDHEDPQHGDGQHGSNYDRMARITTKVTIRAI